MGTAEEEARARAELERVRTENAIKEMQRQEELRRLREQEGESQMVADGPAAAWPDNEVQASPSTRDKVAGALRVGEAGDVAFARDLLNSGQAPLSTANAPDKSADGAKEQTGGAVGSRAANPGLGIA